MLLKFLINQKWFHKILSRIHKVIDGLLCSNHPAKKVSKWHMVWVSAYLTNYAVLCNNVACFGKLWFRPFQWYINHFIPISSPWDMNQSFNISKSFGHFFGSLYIEWIFGWSQLCQKGMYHSFLTIFKICCNYLYLLR